ncbi:MAG TPA: serine hydrolase domain-containing protein [Dokdonella sp.]|uniref:serine hydrolase domain-containing protein n=1 Tax=Dokdonella sp. TaxID=2291710 RepID=UPI002D7EC54D|nr:serine hydrolase domain-containing protein [Dokdonella sp.]HET9034440.1 serine hydrolase domain-containing protein [Dokdonella sp.]
MSGHKPKVDPHAISQDIQPIMADLDRWIDHVESANQVSGLAIAVIQADQVVHERMIGYADTGRSEKIEADTVFRLASLSKAFATTLSGLLVEDGQLSWDTKVTSVLPTFALADPGNSNKLTVADILSHRVGLPHNTYDNLLEQNEPYPLLVERLNEVPIACPVGECYAYQNIAFSLIGDITYALTGSFFYHEVGKRIFHPLGMETASYGRDALEQSAHWARPHRRRGKQWKAFMPNEVYYRMPPAAGVNASLRDMEQWLIAQMGGRPDVLSADLLHTLQTPLVETPRDLRSTPWRRGRLLDAQYALGWRVYEYAGERLVFHAGAVQGYRAMIGFLPKRKVGMVMLWNCESAAPAGLMPMLFDRYLGLPSVDWAGVGPTRVASRKGGDVK